MHLLGAHPQDRPPANMINSRLNIDDTSRRTPGKKTPAPPSNTRTLNQQHIPPKATTENSQNITLKQLSSES